MEKRIDFYLSKSHFFIGRILETEMFINLSVKIYIMVFIAA